MSDDQEKIKGLTADEWSELRGRYEEKTEEKEEEPQAEEAAGDEAEPSGEVEEKAEPAPEEKETRELTENEKKMYAARKHERKKRQEAEKQRDELKERLERLEKLAEQAQQAEPEPIPDPDVDPFNHLAQRLGRSEEQIRAALEFQEKMERQARAQTEYEGLRQRWNRTADEYAKDEAPDFYDAMNHLIDRRAAMYRAQGRSPDQITQILMAEEAAMVRDAEKNGLNPAEVAYEMAKAVGYERAKPKEADMDLDKLDDNVVKMAQKGQQEASGAPRGGPAPQPSMTLERLVGGSDEDVAKAIRSGEAAQLWRRYVRG